MKVLKDVGKNVKQKALPLLTSVTMAATMFAGTGLTAFAFEKDETPHTITYAAGTGATGKIESATTSTDPSLNDAQSFTAADTSVVTKTGYTADGYTVTSGSIYDEKDTGAANKLTEAEAGTKYVATTDATLTVNWKANTYKIKYNPGNATGTAYEDTKTTYTYDEASKKIPSLDTVMSAAKDWVKPTGYEFSNWIDGAEKVYKDQAYVKNLTATDGDVYELTAVWEAGTYPITFEDGYSDDSYTQNVTYGVATKLTTNTFEREGYVFKGWDEDGDGNVDYKDGDSYTLNKEGATLTAVWNGSYTVTLHDTKNNTETALAATEEGDTVSLSADFEYTGYTLAGWATTESATKAAYKLDEVYTVNGNVDLYSVWEKNKYTITLNYNESTTYGFTGDDTIEKNEFTYDTDGKLNPTQFQQITGYNFLGWAETSTATEAKYNVDQDFLATDNSLYNDGEGTTLYGVWELKTPHTVTFDANGGTIGSTTTQIVSGDIDMALLTATELNLKNSGKVFAGWAEDSDSGTVKYTDGADINPSTDVTLYALWDTGYQVTFKGNGGTYGTETEYTQDYVEGAQAPLTANLFTQAGYKFAGWAESSGSKTIKYSDQDIYKASGNKTLYAIWIEDIYTITFAPGNGATIETKTQDIPYGKATKLSTIEELGLKNTDDTRVFIGWTLNASGTEIYAEDGTEITLAADDIRLGDGYKESSLSKTTLTPGTLTLTAVYEDQYVVTLDPNNGDAAEELSAVKGDTVTLTNSFTYENHKFVNWSTSKDGTSGEKFDDGDSYEPAESITLYAIWKVDPSKAINAIEEAKVAQVDATEASNAANDKLEEAKTALENATTSDDAENAAKLASAAEELAESAQEKLDAATKAQTDARTAVDEIQKLAADADITNLDDLDAIDEALSEAETKIENVNDNYQNVVEEATVKAAELEAEAKVEEARLAANDAAVAAKDASEKAEANPTEDTIKAANDAIAAAEKAIAAAEELGVDSDDLADASTAITSAKKAVKTAQTALDEAAKKQQEEAAKSDGSAANTPAPVGTELKDANGNTTGFVVTDATASAPTVEYKGTDADKKATKLVVPATVKDHSGNTYTVTSIAPSAFAKDTSLKNLTIPNTVVKIGKNAFKNCKNLKKVTIKANANLKVGKNAFKGMKKGSKIVVKGVKGAKKTKLVNKVKKQVTSSKTTVK